MSDPINIDDLKNLDPVYVENLGYREPISSTTSYNGTGSRICTKEPTLEKTEDRETYDLDTDSISFAEKTKTIRIGEEYKPVINNTPSIKNLPALTLISDDEEIAKITPDGVIIGVDKGVVTVTAKSSPGGMNSDPDVSDTITITVIE